MIFGAIELVASNSQAEMVSVPELERDLAKQDLEQIAMDLFGGPRTLEGLTEEQWTQVQEEYDRRQEELDEKLEEMRRKAEKTLGGLNDSSCFFVGTCQ